MSPTTSTISPLQSFAHSQASLPVNVLTRLWDRAIPTPATNTSIDAVIPGGHFSGERSFEPPQDEPLRIPVMKHAHTRRRATLGIAWDNVLKDLPKDFWEQEAKLNTVLQEEHSEKVVRPVKRSDCDRALWKPGDPFPCEDFVPPGGPDRNGLWNSRGERTEVKNALMLVLVAVAAAVVAWLL